MLTDNGPTDDALAAYTDDRGPTAHPIDTERLRALTDAASTGPWGARGQYVFADEGRDGIAQFATDADAEFIAAARTAVPALLDENAALRARIKAVEDVLDESTIHYRGGSQGHWPIRHRDIRRALGGDA